MELTKEFDSIICLETEMIIANNCYKALVACPNSGNGKPWKKIL